MISIHNLLFSIFFLAQIFFLALYFLFLTQTDKLAEREREKLETDIWLNELKDSRTKTVHKSRAVECIAKTSLKSKTSSLKVFSMNLKRNKTTKFTDACDKKNLAQCARNTRYIFRSTKIIFQIKAKQRAR